MPEYYDMLKILIIQAVKYATGICQKATIKQFLSNEYLLILYDIS